MSLFQVCYGPEIGSIMRTIQNNPGLTKDDITRKYQYHPSGDISSLIDASINFLLNMNYIKFESNREIIPQVEIELKEIDFLRRLNEIAEVLDDPAEPNFVFASMYYKLFVVKNEMYINNVHYETNLLFDKISLSQEKVNAWKRIMEYLGLGYRVYGGFYALPKTRLIEDIIEEIGEWEGPLQVFFEKIINPIIPCVHNGTVFKGTQYLIFNLRKQGIVKLSKIQDLANISFGEKNECNWIKIGGPTHDSLY